MRVLTAERSLADPIDPRCRATTSSRFSFWAEDLEEPISANNATAIAKSNATERLCCKRILRVVILVSVDAETCSLLISHIGKISQPQATKTARHLWDASLSFLIQTG